MLKGAEYDALNIGEFIFGYMEMMDEERFVKHREDMHFYLNDLMEDLKDRPGEWAVIRSFHGVVLTMMERKTLKWKDHIAIGKLKQRYVYEARGEKQPGQQVQNKQERPQVPCNAYNNGDCSRHDSHNGALHVCSHCLGERGKYHTHHRSACYALVGNSAKKKSSTTNTMA